MILFKQQLPRQDPTVSLLYGGQWRKVAAAVRKRDHNTCQICGQPGRQVHHRVPYRLLRDHNHSDLMTLCKACHGKADAEIQYGVSY